MKKIGGHYRIAKDLAGDNFSSIDIGCKYDSLSPIGLDIDFKVKPTVVGTVFNLPFKNESIEKVFFLETIEHLPKNTEFIALKEINRILKVNGMIILSTPNNTWLSTYSDIAYWLKGHRHYKKEQIIKLIEDAGFIIEYFLITGKYWSLIKGLFYYFLTKPFQFGIPRWLLKKSNREYKLASSKGIAIFIKARKVLSNS